jgi:hypothetical protein
VLTVVAMAPTAGAANTKKGTQSPLANWYATTGHSELTSFIADAHRFVEVNASTTPREASQDCSRFRTDVVAAEHRTLPPGSALSSDYRFYLQAAATKFKECMTGIAAKSAFQLAEGVQSGSLAAEAAVRIIKGAQTGKAINLPPSSTNLVPSLSASLVVPQCEADFKSLEVAVEAYTAQQNAGPVPPAAWSAATYSSNFGPLLRAQGGGPFLYESPDPSYYVIEYDSSGDVWVEPAGQFDTSYDSGHGTYTACADAAK